MTIILGFTLNMRELIKLAIQCNDVRVTSQIEEFINNVSWHHADWAYELKQITWDTIYKVLDYEKSDEINLPTDLTERDDYIFDLFRDIGAGLRHLIDDMGDEYAVVFQNDDENIVGFLYDDDTTIGKVSSSMDYIINFRDSHALQDKAVLFRDLASITP